MKKIFFVSAYICLLTGVGVAQKRPGSKNIPISSLRLIGEYDMPHNLLFGGTTVGGLSGIDYDSKQGVYYMISDDRSAINPARYYTAKIFFTEKKIDSVVFVKVTTLLQKNGTAYPNTKQDPAHTPDPERRPLRGKNPFCCSLP